MNLSSRLLKCGSVDLSDEVVKQLFSDDDDDDHKHPQEDVDFHNIHGTKGNIQVDNDVQVMDRLYQPLTDTLANS